MKIRTKKERKDLTASRYGGEYYRYVGKYTNKEAETSGRSRVNMTKMSWAMWGEEDGIGEGREENQGHQPGGQKYKRVRVIKMSGLYREDPLGDWQSSSWAGELKVEGGYVASHSL